MNLPSELAREAELLRFRLTHHLGGSSERLGDLLHEIEARVPHHPIVRTARAWAALPETALPGPPPELTPAAEAWLAGSPQRALELALEALDDRDHARTAATVADLCWFVGRREEAIARWQDLRQLCGPLPPLEVRLGRAALTAGRLVDAQDRAVHALIQNPLYGSAFVLLCHIQQAQGQEVTPIPLRPQVRQVNGELLLARGLTSPAKAAWLEALEVAREAPAHESPPGRLATQTLLTTWRALRDEGARKNRTERPLRALDEWEQAGLLDSYLWAVGLNPSNAAAFRERLEPEERDRRFWTTGVLENA